jgi:glucans biosynthesis protein C
VLLLDVPIMPILFFLAGYFALRSLQKRGTWLFLKDKLVRIGIPWIFGALFLAPLITYMIYFSRGMPTSFLEFWRTDFWTKLY